MLNTAKGVLFTAGDVAEVAGTAVLNGANDGLEGIQWFLNGGTQHQYDSSEMSTDPTKFNESFSNNPYYSHLGEDFSENYDFSNCNGLFDYAVEGVVGTVETVYDGVMVPVNVAIDLGQDAIEGVKWLWGKIF